MTKLVNTYVTFGQSHTHSVNGKTFDKDCVAVIRNMTAKDGREFAMDCFNKKFFTTYTDETWNEDHMKFFPRGYIALT